MPQAGDATGFTFSQECGKPDFSIRVARVHLDRFRAYRHLGQSLSLCFSQCRENPGGLGRNLHTGKR